MVDISRAHVDVSSAVIIHITSSMVWITISSRVSLYILLVVLQAFYLSATLTVKQYIIFVHEIQMAYTLKFPGIKSADHALRFFITL